MPSSNSANEAFCGFGLNVSERLATKNSMRKVALDANVPESAVSFWGKITATRADYIILQLQQISDKIRNRYYFSVDSGLTFAQVAEVDEFVAGMAPKITGIFSGNPALLLKDPTAPKKKNDEEEEEVEEDEEDEKPKPPPPRRLKELERLAFTIQMIESECCAVPLGAFYMTPTGDIAKDAGFRGLGRHEATQLANYLLLRAPTNALTFARIRAQGVANIHSFLDCVAEEQPKGAWAVQVGEDGQSVSLKALQWPGFELQTAVNSPAFARGYYGNGLRNNDALFML